MTEKDKLHCTSIGGQAVIEGVMMRGPKEIAIAVRKPDQQIIVDKRPVSLMIQKYKLNKIPIVRGVIAFFESMIIGVKALMYSAEFMDIEEEEEPSKFEQFLERKLGDKLKDYIIYFSVFVSLVFSVGLFFVLPNFIIGQLNKLFPSSNILAHLYEGILRIVMFLTYIVLVSKMKDIQRVFQYHGAEHKTIHCYEHQEELTVENVKKHKRLHPRCGTNFLIIVMIISILFFSFLSWGRLYVLMLFKLMLLPVIAGFSYEIIKILGRHDNWLTRIIGAPGMWLQYITTREPDEQQIEVAIAALKGVLTGKKEDDKW